MLPFSFIEVLILHLHVRLPLELYHTFDMLPLFKDLKLVIADPFIIRISKVETEVKKISISDA